MKNKYLIAFDLDDTLLPSVNKIDLRSVEAIKAARAAGHIPFIASARNYNMFRWVYEAMELDTPVCTINGALVFHPSDLTFPTIEHELSADITGFILSKIAEINASLLTYIEHKDRFFYTAGVHNSYYSERIRCADIATEFTLSNLPKTASSRIIISPPNTDMVEHLKKIIKGAFGEAVDVSMWTGKISPTNPSGIRLNIAPSAANKWYAVEHVAKYYGISYENIYAFGDSWNDYLMLRRASHGFALKDSPAAKENVAQHITRYTCRECGVADVIEREILGYKSDR